MRAIPERVRTTRRYTNLRVPSIFCGSFFLFSSPSIWQPFLSLSSLFHSKFICIGPFCPSVGRVTYKIAALTFKTMSSSTNDLIETAVPVRPLRSSDAPLLNVPRTEFARRFFRSRLCTLGTYCHPTLDPAVLWTPPNNTSRPICSDSLNLMPPAPPYLRTLWRYTNTVIISIIYLGLSGVTLPLHWHIRPFTTNGALSPCDGPLRPPPGLGVWG